MSRLGAGGIVHKVSARRSGSGKAEQWEGQAQMTHDLVALCFGCLWVVWVEMLGSSLESFQVSPGHLPWLFSAGLRCPHPYSLQGLQGGDGGVRIAEVGHFPKGLLCPLWAPWVPACLLAGGAGLAPFAMLW